MHFECIVHQGWQHVKSISFSHCIEVGTEGLNATLAHGFLSSFSKWLCIAAFYEVLFQK
jgi:hypothetical protein